MGSVKDLEVIVQPTETRMGIGRFHFSDRYSVFDWGEMPDLIPNKGAALCMMAAYCFEQAHQNKILTHYHGLVDAKSNVIHLSSISSPTNIMEVDLVRVLKPEFKEGKYNYSCFEPGRHAELTNFLIPLEIIYRNSLPAGSSVFSRLKAGELTLEEMELTQQPVPGEKIVKPFFDFSTKLEAKDRYLSRDEAQKISGLIHGDMETINYILTIVNGIITLIATKANLTNEDGKIELAINPQGKLMLVDVLGTPDECRFMYEDVPVSKEVARVFYRKTKWYEAVQQATELAKERGVTNWKELCKLQPPSLPPALKEIISEMYMSTANAFLEKRLFDSPPLIEVVEKYRKWEKES